MTKSIHWDLEKQLITNLFMNEHSYSKKGVLEKNLCRKKWIYWAPALNEKSK